MLDNEALTSPQDAYGIKDADDQRVAAIAAATHDLVKKHDHLLNPKGTSEAELKKRTLTKLYN